MVVKGGLFRFEDGIFSNAPSWFVSDLPLTLYAYSAIRDLLDLEVARAKARLHAKLYAGVADRTLAV